MSDLAWLGAVEAAERIRRKELSPVELTKALLDRIERHDGQLNAFIRVTPEAALAAARSAERAVSAGATLGPLHGVPFALKDIIDVAGLPTTSHSKILLDNVASTDAEVTRKIAAAGGILLGKLSTHEFAIGGPAFDLPFPPARNPWDRRTLPGGSSSGSGAALAAGFAPLAIGTDTGGSIRNPASLCGIVGLKPTYGRVSRRGVFPLAFSLDHIGPMTRDVADNALLLQTIAGYDAHDPGSAERPVPFFAANLERGLKGLKVGVIRHFHTKDMVADPEMTAAIEEATRLMAAEGAEVSEVVTAPLQDYAACNRIILLTEACAIHETWLKERPQDYSQSTRTRLMPGLFLSAVDYLQALRWKRRLTSDFDRLLQSVDVVIAASSMDPAFAIDDPAVIEKFYPRQARAPFNVTGHPALSLPIGFSKAGLPLALQIVGRHWDEAMIYRVARGYERATAWSQRHPTLS